MTTWVLKGATEEEPFPFIVQLLDEKQQVIHHAEESFHTHVEALARAAFLNGGGQNVRVVQELAFCVNKE